MSDTICTDPHKKSSAVLQWALHYAETMGWAIFPAPPDEKKSHKSAEYSGGRRWGATKDADEIRRDFAQWPDAGIGIPTGAENGFWVIETDTKGGKDGAGELAKLQAKHGSLPTTYSTISPSGSVHYYFQHPGTDFYITSSTNKIAHGVDVKGDAGMVVAPPTLRNGAFYDLRVNAAIAEAPAWLLAIVTRKVTDEEKRFVNHAPPTDAPTVAQWEIAKLERYVREALKGNLDWFRDRENVLKTVWGIKRAGYGCEGYQIAQMICEHEEFPETQRVARVDRFWNDAGANKGTVSLNTFWDMCHKTGINDTPDERAAGTKSAEEMFSGVTGAGNYMPSPPLAPPVATPSKDYLLSSAAFVLGFVPPDYLLDGILQKGFLYSLTALTGVGKTTIAMLLAAHVSIGRDLGGLDVAKGPVIYFAGENPTDIRMRWLGLTRAMQIDPETADVHFIDGVVPLSQTAEQITEEIKRKGLAPSLVIVDTAAAYNEGDEENSNNQAGEYARRLRTLTKLPGGPCVIVLCHPAKAAGDDALIPRGGGAFLNEVDGNIALRKLDALVTASAFGKFRGPEFSPLSFELDTVRDHPKLKDVRGRPIPTVIARAIGANDTIRIERGRRMDDDAVLRLLCNRPGISPTDVARALNWKLRAVNGKEPALHHVKAARALERMAKGKLVEERRGGWHATPKGQKDINAVEQSTRNFTPPFPNEQG
jgi:hypothetical protein